MSTTEHLEGGEPGGGLDQGRHAEHPVPGGSEQAAHTDAGAPADQQAVPEPRTGQAGGPSEVDDARDADGSPTLIPPMRAKEFQGRWTELKGQFVDDPKQAARGIDNLVGDVLQELQDVFGSQRSELEKDLGDGSSTEDLRMAFGRYREFFDRLLAL
jgi:hypothetical protein